MAFFNRLVWPLFLTVLVEAFKVQNFLRSGQSLLWGTSSAENVDAPFLRALERSRGDLKSTFFLPSHQKGGFAPKMATEVLGSRAYAFDLPELDGLGNVHDFAPPEDNALVLALIKASTFMGAMRTWFLVNGSTSGVLIAIMVLRDLHASSRTSNGTKRSVVIVTRDSHKSVFDALEVANCDAWVLPCSTDEQFGVSTGVDTDLVIESIAQCKAECGGDADIAGIVLTRPTYQGLGLHGERFKDLIQKCHSLQVPVVVDEAHGSHWRLLRDEDGYNDALSCGADLVIQSTHKTMGAMSQAGMLHLGRAAFTCSSSSPRAEEVIHRHYSMFTSTSPNALLLASLDAARAQAEISGIEDVQRTVESAAKLRESIKKATGGDDQVAFLCDSALVRGGTYVVDPLRVSVHFSQYSDLAVEIDEWMCEQLGLWCELNLPRCIVYCLPLGAASQDLAGLASGLVRALSEVKSGGIRIEQKGVSGSIEKDQGEQGQRNCGVYLPSLGAGAGTPRTACLVDAIDSKSAENVVPYPPGIPVLLRGETVTKHHVDVLSSLQANLGSGRYVLCTDPSLTNLSVYYEH